MFWAFPKGRAFRYIFLQKSKKDVTSTANAHFSQHKQ